MQQFWNFLEQQGENITKLVIEGHIEIENLVKIFSFASKVEDLTFNKLFISSTNDDILDLQHLKSLTMLNIDSCYDFDFSKLKIAENVLQNLNIATKNCKNTFENDLKNFLKTQKNLKDFKIDDKFSRGLGFVENWPEIRNLEKFSFCSMILINRMSHSFIEQFLVQQKHLKVLKLDKNISNEIFLQIVDNLINLQHLSISFENLTSENFEKNSKT